MPDLDEQLQAYSMWLAKASDHAAAPTPVAVTPGAERTRPFGWVFGLVAAVALAAVGGAVWLGSSAGPERVSSPSVDVPVPSTVPDDGGDVVVPVVTLDAPPTLLADDSCRFTGGVIETPDHGPEIAMFWLFSYPPQGGGVPLVGWDWDAAPGFESSGGTRWGDEYLLVGRWDGERFTLTRPPEAASHRAPDAEDGSALPECDFGDRWRDQGQVVYEANVFVIETPEHGPEIAFGVAETYPPQGGGIPLVGWDWSEALPFESVSGTTWGGNYRIVGTYDGESFTLTEPPTLTSDPSFRTGQGSPALGCGVDQLRPVLDFVNSLDRDHLGIITSGEASWDGPCGAFVGAYVDTPELRAAIEPLADRIRLEFVFTPVD